MIQKHQEMININYSSLTTQVHEQVHFSGSTKICANIWSFPSLNQLVKKSHGAKLWSLWIFKTPKKTLLLNFICLFLSHQGPIEL